MIWQNATHMHTTTTPNVLVRPTRSQGAVGATEKNVQRDIMARLEPRFAAAKNKTLLVLGLLLALPGLALSQSDPLSPTYLPSIDTKGADYPGNIWITDTMQKIRQDSGAPGTQHWGTFYGTQNEFVDFQVHVQAPAGGYSGLSVTTSDFVNSRTGTHISASSTNIVVYREAYVHIQGYPSNNQQDSGVPGGANYNTYYGGALGYYPDILIPTVDPYWHQTTNAWPFNVAAGKNQSAWIDVLIPSNAPSGNYLGTVTVKNGTTVLAAMPVIIAVWQWPNAGYMPATATLKSFVGNLTYGGLCLQMYTPATSTAACGSYPGGAGLNDSANAFIWLDASLLIKDHRFGFGSQEQFYVTSGSFSSFNTYVGPLMNGGCIPHPSAGSTCPVLPNSKQNMKSMDNLSTFSAAVWSNWQNEFVSRGWGAAGTTPLYFFLMDEPGDSNIVSHYTSIYNNAKIYHSYLQPGIPLMVTNDIWFYQTSQSAADSFSTSICGSATCLQNSEDIMVPTISTLEPIGAQPQPLSSYKAWVVGSVDGIPRQWWSYLACTTAGTCSDAVPGPAGYGTAYTTWPNYNVDGKAAANRAMEWLTFLHGQTGELYYQSEVCNTPSYNKYCVPPGVTWDPWNGIYYSGGWGDGTLVYAGGVSSGAINYMGAGVTIPIVLPSIRLNHIRDGVQDYEYLYALSNAGRSSLVQTQISSWITNSYTFETSGAGLQAARTALGTAMHRLSYPSLLPPPTNPQGKVQ